MMGSALPGRRCLSDIATIRTAICPNLTGFSDRPCGRRLRVPASGKYAIVHDRYGYPVAFRYRSPTFSGRRHSDTSAIARLHSVSSPGAVARFVSTVVVDTFDREIVSVSVGQSPVSKDREASPLDADRDTSSAVVLEAITLGIETARVHVSPRIVETRSGRPVGSSPRSDDKRLSTAAASGLPRAKVGGNYVSFGSTSTPASPNCATSRGVTGLFNSAPITKAELGDIDESLVFYHDHSNIYKRSWYQWGAA